MDIGNGILFAQLPAASQPAAPPSETPVTPPAGDWLDTAIHWVADHTSTDWILEKVKTFGPNLISAIAIFVIGRWLARLVTAGIMRAARRARVDETLLGFLNNLTYMLLLTAVCISALDRLGVDATSLTAVLTASAFAVGMAMQGSLGNLASGVMLVFFKPFLVGDVVEVIA